jgi:hypothetical protein
MKRVPSEFKSPYEVIKACKTIIFINGPSNCVVYYLDGESYMKVTWYKPCHIAHYSGRGFRRHFYDDEPGSHGTRPKRT